MTTAAAPARVPSIRDNFERWLAETESHNRRHHELPDRLDAAQKSVYLAYVHVMRMLTTQRDTINGKPNKELGIGHRSTREELVAWCNIQARVHGIAPNPERGPQPGTDYVCTLENFGSSATR